MQQNNPIKLNDVYILRPIAIFFIIVYHSFIIFRGGWRQPVDYQNIEAYYFIATVSYAFWLELFVFISGYVFGLSLQRKQPSFKSTLVDKFKRLIIPSIVFSSIYYFMFYDTANFSFSDCIIKVLSGAGHMWFLPMLFWTMFICLGIDNIKVSEKWKLIGVLVLPVFSLAPLPFQLNQACYYTMFFYTGMLFFRQKETIIEHLAIGKRVVALTFLFIILFVLGIYVREFLINNQISNVNSLIKAVLYLTSKYVRIVYCIAGILWIYALVNYLLKTKNINIPQWIINLSPVCFGVYLFQQFILQYLYYKTNIPSLVGSYWLPWVGLIVTTIGSYFLACLLRMTKIGRKLI